MTDLTGLQYNNEDFKIRKVEEITELLLGFKTGRRMRSVTIDRLKQGLLYGLGKSAAPEADLVILFYQTIR